MPYFRGSAICKVTGTTIICYLQTSSNHSGNRSKSHVITQTAKLYYLIVTKAITKSLCYNMLMKCNLSYYRIITPDISVQICFSTNSYHTHNSYTNGENREGHNHRANTKHSSEWRCPINLNTDLFTHN